MSNLLNYSPAPQSPVRFGRMAMGAWAALFTVLCALVSYYSPRLAPGRTAFAWLLTFIPSIAGGIVLIAAIALLASGLRTPPGRTRVGFYACLALAVLALLLRVVGASLNLAGIRVPLGSNSAWAVVSLAITCLSVLTNIALLAAAGVYGILLGARLDRKPLGIFTALTFLPSLLYFAWYMCYLTWRLLALIAPLPAPSFSYYGSVAGSLNLVWLALVWLGMALAASILALRQR